MRRNVPDVLKELRSCAGRNRGPRGVRLELSASYDNFTTVIFEVVAPDIDQGVQMLDETMAADDRSRGYLNGTQTQTEPPQRPDLEDEPAMQPWRSQSPPPRDLQDEPLRQPSRSQSPPPQDFEDETAALPAVSRQPSRSRSPPPRDLEDEPFRKPSRSQSSPPRVSENETAAPPAQFMRSSRSQPPPAPLPCFKEALEREWMERMLAKLQKAEEEGDMMFIEYCRMLLIEGTEEYHIICDRLALHDRRASS